MSLLKRQKLLNQLSLALQIPPSLLGGSSLNHWSQSVSSLSAFSGSDQEVVPGVLRGYRAWMPYWEYTDVMRTEPRLRALNFLAAWTPGRNVAICQNQVNRVSHTAGVPVPHAYCTCGFYARHGSFFGINIKPIVVGVIKAYGKVVLGTEGFRAQYADVEALSVDYLDAHAEQAAVSLEGFYQVPVYRTRADMVRDYPPISVEHLLPAPPPASQEMIDFWTRGPGSKAMLMTPTGPVTITEIRASFEEGKS